MRPARILAAASPYAAAVGTGLLIAMLIATMSLTAFEKYWIVFLSGVLAAAVFSLLSHSVSARWMLARRTAQLNASRAKLVTESRKRSEAEASLARLGANTQFVDLAMPAMVAYVDAAGIIRYHNHSYARWIGLADNAIDGRSVEQVLGVAVHAEISSHLNDALAGREVRYERMHKAAGASSRLFVQYLPHHDAGGKVAGVFAILTDITRAEDLAAPAPKPAEAQVADALAARLIEALERDEFTLFSQSIVPLGAAGDGASFCEVLLRMNEEEEKLLPPGTFLPVAEENGLLPDLDRWVIRNVLKAAAAQRGGSDAVYFVNLSPPTAAQAGLAAFVRRELDASGLDGKLLCFEFPEADVLAQPRAYRDLIAALDGSGCRFAVSGFGRNAASVQFLRQLRVSYVKLDGAVALNLTRGADELARAQALIVAAHAAGMQVVAQCVENDATRASLQLIQADFVQGFGIAMPRPMRAARAEAPPHRATAGLERAAA
jgi:PAS domain S-box-containing protein